MSNLWRPEEIKILEDNYLTKLHKELAAMLGGRSLTGVRSKLRKLNLLLSEDERLRRRVDCNRRWTAEMDNFLRANYVKFTMPQLAAILGCTPKAVKSRTGKLKITLPEEVRKQRTGYKKGNTPVNKGAKGIHLSPCTEFKKGHKPANTKYNGCITIRRNKKQGINYTYIRIAESKWRQLHQVIWEKANGKIPKGMILVFKDGDTSNCSLQNLLLVTRKEHLERNTKNRTSDGYIAARIFPQNKELREAIKQMPAILELQRLKTKLKRMAKNA